VAREIRKSKGALAKSDRRVEFLEEQRKAKSALLSRIRG
jgi:hypothetical protein